MDGGKLIWILAMAKYNLLFLFSLFFYRAKFRYIHELEAKIEHFSIKTGLSVTATGIITYEVLDRRRGDVQLHVLFRMPVKKAKFLPIV